MAKNRDRQAEGIHPGPHGDKATITGHDAVMGIWTREVRKWWVSEPKPYAQHPVAVEVSYIEPRKRRSISTTVCWNHLYLTIENARGETVYDSRDDVPIDMAEWEAMRSRLADRPGVITIGRWGARVSNYFPERFPRELTAGKAPNERE